MIRQCVQALFVKVMLSNGEQSNVFISPSLAPSTVLKMVSKVSLMKTVTFVLQAIDSQA